MTPKQLYEVGDKLFGKRTQLLSLWQSIADNFYVERADFTTHRSSGAEFAADLMSSYPLLARRDLGNTLGTMLRPTEKPWFHIRTEDINREDIDVRRWLEWAEQVMRRAMYDRDAQFVRAAKEGDHDFAAFGQCVISVEYDPNAVTLLYRCWHLRDVAWAENARSKISQVYRRWKPTVRDLINLFGSSKVHPQIVKTAEKDPFAEVKCMHMVVESDMCDGTYNTPYVSIYYDCEHQTVLEERPSHDLVYVIPRWQTVSGSQYAYSPATVAALPDARLIQAMTLTLLEAGEKAVNPPMLATQEAIRSDIAIYPGGVTWVDRNYDERLGEVLRPLAGPDKNSMTLGVEMQRDSRLMIMEAFYLNKFSMPDRGKAEMTAFEIGQRVQEYIRQALPIFEPMEMEYNGAICDSTFDILMRQGAFGAPQDMPRGLQGARVDFKFESPLHDAIESVRSHQLMEAKTLLADAIALDPTVAVVMDIETSLRDALIGIGVPAKWIRNEREYQAAIDKQRKAAQTQQMLSTLQQGADVAKTLGEAQGAMGSGATPPPGTGPAGRAGP